MYHWNVTLFWNGKKFSENWWFSQELIWFDKIKCVWTYYTILLSTNVQSKWCNRTYKHDTTSEKCRIWRKSWNKTEFALGHFINKFLWFPLGDVCYVCTKISNVMVNDKSAFKEHWVLEYMEYQHRNDSLFLRAHLGMIWKILLTAINIIGLNEQGNQWYVIWWCT